MGWLVADRWRIVQQEIARTARGVIWVCNLGGSCVTLGVRNMGTVLRVTKKTLVIGATALPTEIARSATDRSIATVAVFALHMLATGTRKR